MDKDKEIQYRCKHLREAEGMSKTYFLFEMNDTEIFYVCRLCFASIQQQVISLLTEVRVKVR